MCIRLTYFVTILMALAAVNAGAAPTAQSRDEQELVRLEGVWNDAHTRGDAAALERLFDEDITVTVPGMRPFNKTDATAAARSSRFKFKRYETSDVVFHLYGNAAVVTGKLERTRSIEGRDVNDKWRFTKVYIRRGRQWRVVAWHASTVE